MATKITDGQVRRLWRWLDGGAALREAATKTGMDRKTARRYRNMRRLPSQNETPRDWRTRPDPFAEVWPEIAQQLEKQRHLAAKELFQILQTRHPDQFPDSQLRTFQRRVKIWRTDYATGRLALADLSQTHSVNGKNE